MLMQNSNLGEYRRNLEMDPGVSCKNYPTEKFSSYQDCDESFVYNLMKNKYKIMPFWAARKLDEVTETGYDMLLFHKKYCSIFRIYDISKSEEFGNLINGNLISNCPLPCLSTKVHFGFAMS